MEIEISFMPKKWISNIPDAGGYFPFAIDGETMYVVDFLFDAVDPNEFIPDWILQLNKFPIYIYVEIFEFQTEELEQDFKVHNVEYNTVEIEKKYDIAYKATIENSEQFKAIFPYLYGNGSMNNLALWSLQKDVFSFGKRDFKTLLGRKKVFTPIVSLEDNDCVFWVGYDGQNIVAISNNKLFSSVDCISNQFPPKANIITGEYEED